MTLPVKKMIASDSVSNNPCSFCSIGKLVAACDQEIENEYHYLYRGVKLVFVCTVYCDRDKDDNYYH